MRTTTFALLTTASMLLAGCPSSPPTPAPASGSATVAARPVPTGMPIASLKVRSKRGEGQYVVDVSAIHQAIALASAGELPLATTGDGYRVLRADEGSLLAQIGFRVDDELLAIANVPVLTADLLVQLHPVWDQGKFQITYRRGGQERSHTYAIYDPPQVAPCEGEGGGEPASVDQAAFAKLVKRAPDGSIELTREAFSMLLEKQALLMREARVVPSTEGDRVTGLKVFGIRRGSPLEVLGFQNGDTLKTMAGYDLTDPQKALEAYSKIKGMTEVEVAIVRDGKPLTWRYRLVD